MFTNTEERPFLAVDGKKSCKVGISKYRDLGSLILNENHDAFNELNENGASYYRRLISYINWQARTMTWAGGDPGMLAKGQTPKDVAQEVFRKALDGTRKFDPERGTFMNWLRDQARSELNHLAESVSHRLDVELSEDELIPDANTANPEAALIAQEDRDEHQKIVSQTIGAVFESVEGKPDLEEVVEAIMSGCTPYPRYLAKELNLAVKDVNNRLKRLRRLLRKERVHSE